jgi:ribosome modulation factor
MSPAKAVNRWRMTLIRTFERGQDARKAGVKREACPYHGNNGLQRQRRSYWLQGWDSEGRGQ